VAGEYYFGDGLGVNVNLTLAPENGFVFTWQGCLGLYDLNYGDVAFTNGTVKLLFKFPNVRQGFEGIAPELLPVRWGQRHYLIAVDNIVDFANEINAGTEPSSLFGGKSGEFPLRRGDEKLAVEGQPDLPREFLSYLLAEPIETKIISVGRSPVEQPSTEQYRRTTYVAIGVGSVDRLKKGMRLHVIGPADVIESALITDVDEHSATAVIEQFDASDPPPSVGWELSTKFQ